MFTSGYNNVSPGDGNGRLFVVNANSGQRLLDVQTYTSGTVPAGTSAAPSGLAKINGWVDSRIDNTTRRIYGGDLLGNLWRFDIDGSSRRTTRLCAWPNCELARPSRLNRSRPSRCWRRWCKADRTIPSSTSARASCWVCLICQTRPLKQSMPSRTRSPIRHSATCTLALTWCRRL